MTTPPTARDRLHRAVVEVATVLAARDATEAQLNDWAGVVEAFAARIGQSPPESVFWGLGQQGLLAVSGVPGAGKVGEWSAPAQGLVVANVVFGGTARGHQGMAHGGSIAATFDEVLGLLWTFNPGQYVTANLGIRYIAPVPLNQTILFEAREVSRLERRVSCECTARLGDELLAEASALFVSNP